MCCGEKQTEKKKPRGTGRRFGAHNKSMFQFREMNKETLHTIEFQDPTNPRQLWAMFEGPRIEAAKSARGLLRDLNENGHPGVRVWLNGKRIKIQRKGPDLLRTKLSKLSYREV